jgi:hypothetical protein
MQENRKQRHFVAFCRTSGQLLLKARTKSGSAARAIWRSFIFFWNIPPLGPLGPTDSHHWY